MVLIMAIRRGGGGDYKPRGSGFDYGDDDSILFILSRFCTREMALKTWRLLWYYQVEFATKI